MNYEGRHMTRRCMVTLIVLTTVFFSSFSGQADDSAKIRVYFGTYRSSTSRGIYVSSLDGATGQLSPPQLAAEVMNPSFVALHPSGQFLYAVSEVADFQGKPVGTVSAFSIDAASGKLALLNQQPSSGAGPCHLVVDAKGKNVLVANYTGGNVAVLPIADDGLLKAASSTAQHHGKSVNPQRQEAPHAHSINLDQGNNFAFAADLGLDEVKIYQFDAGKGLLTPNNPPAAKAPAGGGPRHLAFHPTGLFAYVNNELTSSVTAFGYDSKKGTMIEIETITTLPQPQSDNTTAEVVVHPSGKFLYVSNRGHDSLAMFLIDQSNGRLTVNGHQSTGGKTPRNFCIDPSGQFLLAANQGTNNIVVFKIDQTSGKLTPTGHSVEVGSPVCVRFLVSKK